MSKIKSDKVIWITWHYAARSRNMAQVLGIPIFEYFNTKNVLIRHTFSSVWTIWVLLRQRPKVIFLQLSFMLLNIVVLYKFLSFGKVTIIADCHTKALRRKARGIFNYIFWPIKKFTFRFVNISIVSNIGMEKDIKQLHSHYFIIPDKIPVLKINKVESNEKYFVYISSFAVDEPFEEIFDVVKLLPKEYKFYWTGKISQNKKFPQEIPNNLIFTDYISFEKYYELIANAEAILALTTEDDCLQSGAYEALAVETPMVISDTEALRNYFSNAAIYTKHDPHQIKEKLLEAANRKDELVENIRKIKKIRDEEFDEIINKLISEVNNLS